MSTGFYAMVGLQFVDVRTPETARVRDPTRLSVPPPDLWTGPRIGVSGNRTSR